MTPSTELTLFIVTALLGCIFSLFCLPWRTGNMNLSSAILSSWLLVGCFVLFMNSLVMNTKIWCDICEQFRGTNLRSERADIFTSDEATKLMVGTYVGVPASMICVLHQLYATISTPDSLPEKVRRKTMPVVLFLMLTLGSSDSTSCFVNSPSCCACQR